MTTRRTMRRIRWHLMASFAAVVAVIAGLMVTPASAAGGVSATFSKSSNRGNGYEGDYTQKNVGYFVQWGVYGRNYHVKNIETSGTAAKLTYIDYAFGNVTNGQCAIGDSHAGRQKNKGQRAGKSNFLNHHRHT